MAEKKTSNGGYTASKWYLFKKNYGGWVYMIPVLVGILGFTVLPMVTSFVYSICDYKYYEAEISKQLSNFGFQNYIKMFTTDWPSVGRSLFLTFRYAVVSVAVNLVGSYILALFCNQKLKGIGGFRILYYLPCIIPAMAGTLLWKNITNVDTGYINLIFDALNIPRYSFYNAKDTVFPTIIILGLFGLGGNIVMWVAQMKNIPNELYESADLDGANYFHKLFHITIPLTTSMIFYLLINSIIGSLQVFGGFYALRNGVNDSEINFIVVKIYGEAFDSMDMSYACALSWLLFVIIGVLTASIFKTSKWVYYGEEA